MGAELFAQTSEELPNSLARIRASAPKFARAADLSNLDAQRIMLVEQNLSDVLE
jgi:hypothetical protein